jgi:hypothetical protein
MYTEFVGLRGPTFLLFLRLRNWYRDLQQDGAEIYFELGQTDLYRAVARIK